MLSCKHYVQIDYIIFNSFSSSMVSFTLDMPCFKNHILIAILFLLIPLATCLSFNFTSFTPNDLDSINYEGSAYMTSNVIQLAHNGNSVGRATYSQPLHLWDKASRNLTDFTTHFSFSIDSLNSSKYADGMAFFLRPNGSKIPADKSGGGSLGLTGPFYSNMTSTDNAFVAVEFDIFPNDWDPPYTHVGIDTSSLKSVTDVMWWSNTSIMEGWQQKATISYDSRAKNLSVVFTGWIDSTEITQRLSYIVDLRDHLSEFVTVGISASTGFSTSVYTLYSWNFNSNLELNGNKETVAAPPVFTSPGAAPPVFTPAFSSSGKGKIGIMVIALAAGGCLIFFVLALGLVICCFCRNRTRLSSTVYKKTFEASISDAFGRGSGPKNFAYDDLKRATNNFAHKDKLGEGGFGCVYKGFLQEMDSFIAVKRVSSDSEQGIKEYASEVKIISRVRHRNLVQIIGWCHERQELLLVYEFMPNGSLDSHLFKGKSLLSWVIRFKIARGLASALLYLHDEWEQCVLHRDIKSSNVMLDAKFEAKLGDFGLSRLVDHGKGPQTTVLAGTVGYMAPESMITGKSSKETDVFSFGVVALEIATGRKAIDPNAEQCQVNLVEWVWSLYGTSRLLDAADPLLESYFNWKEMEQLMLVGLWCAHPDSDSRLSIRQAVLALNFEATLPTLPLKMPVPTY